MFVFLSSDFIELLFVSNGYRSEKYWRCCVRNFGENERIQKERRLILLLKIQWIQGKKENT